MGGRARRMGRVPEAHPEGPADPRPGFFSYGSKKKIPGALSRNGL
jgi:hypothetical protein